MLWEDFLLSTVRPYPADWMIVGGWGCLNYLIRLDEDLRPFLVLGQNGGLHVEEEDEDDDEEGHGEDSGLHGYEPGEGLPAPGGSDWAEEGPDLGGMGRGDVPYLRRVARP